MISFETETCIVRPNRKLTSKGSLLLTYCVHLLNLLYFILTYLTLVSKMQILRTYFYNLSILIRNVDFSHKS